MQTQREIRKINYAKLLIQTGVNLQPGQRLILTVPVECADFARALARAAYEAGASEVVTVWEDDELTKLKYLQGAEEIFPSYPAWKQSFYEDYSREGAAFLRIYASDPENLRDVDPRRLHAAELAAGKALEGYRNRQTANEIPWCIASVPTLSWAKKMFPNYSDDDAMEALWEAIYQAVRVVGDGADAKERWAEHLAMLEQRKDKLTAYQFQSLHYKNSLGTDFTIDLPEDHIWEAGGEHTRSGVAFVANMPTEEIFTAPKRDSAQGVLVSSLPLVHQGNIIDKFCLRFENGKIVEATAEIGQELLQSAISLDEGASYLGEIALVPYHSPLSLAGILFYNTLFDENASCHFAFGDSYPCLKDAATLSKEEQKKRGLNESMTHVDFMIGTADLDITGITKEGRQIPLFRQGDFVL